MRLDPAILPTVHDDEVGEIHHVRLLGLGRAVRNDVPRCASMQQRDADRR